MTGGKFPVASTALAWLANQRHHGNRALNAFITCTGNDSSYVEKLRDAIDRESCYPGQAYCIDRRLIVFKDNICTLDENTTCASEILRGHRSPFSATVVQRLVQQGAYTSGKTNLDEFAMGSHSIHSAFGPTRNHLTKNGPPLSAGGSSGGSAVAVATDQCFASLGTDTGGSVRLPAAYTGIVGFKPSYGRLSRWGVVAYANSLDTVGILTKGVKDALVIYAHFKMTDRQDPTNLSKSSASRMKKRFQPQKFGNQKRPIYRIGVPKEYNLEELDPIIRQAWLKTLKELRSRGHSIHAVSLPTTEVALSAYYVIAAAEASSNLAKYDGIRYGNRNIQPKYSSPFLYAETRGARLGKEVKKRILLGSYSLSAGAIDNYFIQAQRVRRLVQEDFNNVFRNDHPFLPSRAPSKEVEDGVDFLITPTTPSLPPTLESISAKTSVDTFADDVLTVSASLAGLPALTIPVAIERSPPTLSSDPSTVGIQIIGQYGWDIRVLELGERLSFLSSH